MKWLSKIFKSGAGTGGVSTGEQQPQFSGDENMVWRAPFRSLVWIIDLSFFVLFSLELARNINYYFGI